LHPVFPFGMQEDCFPPPSHQRRLGSSLNMRWAQILEEPKSPTFSNASSAWRDLHPSLGDGERNGGDFDFGHVCIMPSDQFPRFVADDCVRGQFRQQKTKLTRRSLLWNVLPGRHEGAWKQNWFHYDLKTSCLAAGRRTCIQARRTTAERLSTHSTPGWTSESVIANPQE